MKKFLTDNAYIIMGVLAAAAIYMWYSKKSMKNTIAAFDTTKSVADLQKELNIEAKTQNA